MPATTQADLRNEIRDLIKLWPERDVLQVALDVDDTTVDVEDALRIPRGSWIEVNDEVMFVRASDENTNLLIVRRRDKGTLAAAHDADEDIFVHGPYDVTNREINLAIRDAINWLYPVACLDIWDDLTDTEEDLLEYAIPEAIESLAEVYLEDQTASNGFRRLHVWSIIGESLWLPRALQGGRKLKFHGYGRFTLPQGDGDELDTGSDLFQAVKFYAAGTIIKSQEALRARFTGQSALLEARSGNLGDLLGSSREWLRLAKEIRSQAAEPRPFVLRRIFRG